MDKNIGVI